MAANPKYTTLRVTTATGLPIKGGQSGVLGGVSINKALVGTITIKDGSNTMAVLTNGTTAPLGMVLQGAGGGIAFQNLTVTMTTSTEDVTFIYE